MEKYVTLDRSNPDLQVHLLGEPTKNIRAIPVRSMNVNSQNEKVTFQLLPISELKRPPLFLVLLQVIRSDLLPLTLIPATAILMLFRTRLVQIDLALWALASLFFLHGAIFCRNDFIDHMRGVDRVNEKGGSRVIQRGWLLASTVQKIYWVMGFVSLLFAAPVFWIFPELLALACVVALAGVYGYSQSRWGRGHWFFSSLAIFLCLGPLLTAGMSYAMAKSFELSTLLVGVYFGGLALLYTELRHTISMVVDHEAGLSTLPVKLGFDHTKKALFVIVLLSLFSIIALVSALYPGPQSLVALPLVAWLTFLAKKIVYIQSPLSSALYDLPQEVCFIHLVSGLFLIAMTFL